MGNILLDYAFPISVITPTNAASTAFLKQVCIAAKPKAGQEGNVGTITLCTSMTAVGVLTANTNAQQLFDAGMSRVYVLLANHLYLTEALAAHLSKFYTLLISDDFTDSDMPVDPVAASLVKDDLTFTAKDAGPLGNDISIEFLDTGTAGSEVVTVTDKKISVSMEDGVSTATQLKNAIDASTAAMALIDPVTVAPGQGGSAQAAFAEDNLEDGAGLIVGSFDGVVGSSTQDAEVAADRVTAEGRCAFLTSVTNKAKNLFYAFGKLLSNASNWRNQQYISMPVNDGIDELGEADALFDDRVSFVLNDDEFGNRLGLFSAGGKAIVAPYIMKNLRIDLQSRALQWISANQPQYTVKEAALLEETLQDEVVNLYIARKWIASGSVRISVVPGSNFTAIGSIEVPTPTAMWRVESEMVQTA